MTNKKSSLVSLVFVCSFLVVSCGGSSEPKSPSEPSTPSPQPPQTYELSVRTTYVDSCGEVTAHPDTTVFIHNESWQVLDKKESGVDGIAEFVFDDNNPRPIAIVSYSGPREELDSTILIHP